MTLESLLAEFGKIASQLGKTIWLNIIFPARDERRSKVGTRVRYMSPESVSEGPGFLHVSLAFSWREVGGIVGASLTLLLHIIQPVVLSESG